MSWCDKVLKNSAKYWEKYSYSGISWGGETGVFIGGVSNSNTSWNNVIDNVVISSTGNATDFGDATSSHPGQHSGASNGEKAFFGPGGSGTAIHQITFSNKSDSILFGNLQYARDYLGSLGNKDRTVFGPGRNQMTIIEYFESKINSTISSFGNMSVQSLWGCGTSNDNRGLFLIGNDNTSTVNTVHYITISQTSNSLDFGDLISASQQHVDCCCDGKAIISCCYGFSGAFLSTIEYMRIEVLSNSLNFGNLTTLRIQGAACTNGLRGVFGGGLGKTINNNCNTIEYVTGSSLGNSLEFGSLTSSRGFLASCSGN